MCAPRFVPATACTSSRISVSTPRRVSRAAEDQTLSLIWATTLTSPGRISLNCWPENQFGPAPVVSDGSLAVLPVSTITP